MVLAGLKKLPVELSAVVSMTDDGGSSGVLRDELVVLPPGDVRQCLVALAQSSQMLRDLFNYRYLSGGLKGHSFGNQTYCGGHCPFGGSTRRPASDREGR